LAELLAQSSALAITGTIMDGDRVFARFLQDEEAMLASQIINDRNLAQLLEEEEHVNDGVLP